MIHNRDPVVAETYPLETIQALRDQMIETMIETVERQLLIDFQMLPSNYKVICVHAPTSLPRSLC